MKPIISLLLILLSFSSVAQNIRPYLIAYYPFQGDLKDYSGNGFDGVGHGGVGYGTDKFGNANNALRLDGINDWVQIPNIKLGPRFAFSILVRLDTLKPQMILSLCDTGGNAPNHQVMKFGYNMPYIPPINFQGDTFFAFRVSKTGNNCDSNGIKPDTVSVHVPTRSGLTPYPTTNNWYCIYGFYHEGMSTAYSLHLLGNATNLVSNYAYGSTIADTCNGMFKIGKWWNNNPLFMKGYVDELRIYRVDSAIPYTLFADTNTCKIIPIVATQKIDTGFCHGATSVFRLPYIANNMFNAGNVFTAQLSDTAGNFTSPLNIGTITSYASDTITCTIPSSLPLGNKYKIRIVSSLPYSESADNHIRIEINTKPIVTAGSNSPLCALSDTLRLTGSSSISNVQYLWTGKISSLLQNPIIPNVGSVYNGQYILRAKNRYCISNPDTVSVLVKSIPENLALSYNNSVCEADTLKLTCTTSTSGVSFSWTGPLSFSSTIQNPVLSNTTTSASGKYYMNATTGNGCYAKDSITVLVKPLPTSFNAVAGSICEGNVFFLAGNTSSAGVSFSWTGPNGFTSTLQNPNISSATTAATGNYYVTGTLNGCSVKDTVYGSVYPIPARPLSIANTPVCVGQDLKLNVSNPQSGVYSWIGIGGYSAAIVSPVRTSAATAMAGKYYVTVTANGCTSDKDSVTVVVNPAPVINMYPSPKDSICQGATLTFISSTANAGTSFQRYWYRNNTVIGGASNANYSTTTAADNDEYYVTLVATGVCAEPYTDTSNKIIMRVFPWLPASVSIVANPATTVPSGTMVNFTATPVNGGNKPTYQWTRNGTPVVGALSNIWGASTLSNNDEICVNMSSSYLCPNPKTAKSNCIKVSIESTGINSLAGNAAIHVYPNPVKDVLNIDGIKAGCTITLYDISGRLLLQQTALADKEIVNTAMLASGVYQLIITENTTTTRFRITKD